MLGFRVWDIKNRKFHEDKWFDFLVAHDGQVVKASPAHWNIAFHSPGSDEFKAMQSTGIRDWKNKEIFEGDMLFIKFKDEDIINKKPEYYLVESTTDFLRMLGRWESTYWELKISIDGNIYEQPTLKERLNE